MQNERLATLKKLEFTDKEDVTIKYFLALEYKKMEDLTCERYFDILFKDFPEYLPPYYISGEYYYEKEEYQKSFQILTKGLVVAKEQKNQKAIAEIQNLLMNVEFELE